MAQAPGIFASLAHRFSLLLAPQQSGARTARRLGRNPRPTALAKETKERERESLCQATRVELDREVETGAVVLHGV